MNVVIHLNQACLKTPLQRSRTGSTTIVNRLGAYRLPKAAVHTGHNTTGEQNAARHSEGYPARNKCFSTLTTIMQKPL